MDKILINSYLPYVNPFATEDDLKDVIQLNEYEILFIFKNGTKRIFNIDLQGTTGLYPDNHELTLEECQLHFSIRLKRWMSRRGITQEELSQMTNISRQMLSRYVTGQALPGYYAMYKIAKALNCSLDEFFYREY